MQPPFRANAADRFISSLPCRRSIGHSRRPMLLRGQRISDLSPAWRCIPVRYIREYIVTCNHDRPHVQAIWDVLTPSGPHVVCGETVLAADPVQIGRTGSRDHSGEKGGGQHDGQGGRMMVARDRCLWRCRAEIKLDRSFAFLYKKNDLQNLATSEEKWRKRSTTGPFYIVSECRVHKAVAEL